MERGEKMDNIMPPYLISILGLLIWITSKIIFIFLEIIIIQNVLYKRHKIVESNFFILLKESYKYNRAEINATIFHTFLNVFTFLATLLICTNYTCPEACTYVCSHVGLLLSFDLIITIIILLVLNYLLKYKIVYKLECKPLKVNLEELKEFLS